MADDASTVGWDGSMFGNQNMATLTPSATAMIVLVCVVGVFAIGVGFTYLEKHLGLFEKVDPYVVDDVDQYRQMVKRISRQGEELRQKSLMADLPLCALDPETRNAVCTVCQRPCHEANFGSATSAFRGRVTSRGETKADGTLDDDFLCVDCFAFIDSQEHAHAKKILEDWHQQGAHASISPPRKRAQLGSPTAAASSRVASPTSATGIQTSGNDNGADDEDNSLPTRLTSKRSLRKQATSPQQAEQNSQSADQVETKDDGESAASETRSRRSSSAGDGADADLDSGGAPASPGAKKKKKKRKIKGKRVINRTKSKAAQRKKSASAAEEEAGQI